MNKRLLQLAASSLPAALLMIHPNPAPAFGRVVFSMSAPHAAMAVNFPARAAVTPAGAVPITGLQLKSVTAGPDPAATARQIARMPSVAWAEPDRSYHLLGSDPRRKNQWALDAIHAEQGWLLAGLTRLPSLDGVPIAIVDSGADVTHEDLKGRILACAASAQGRVREGICSDGAGHGTHVSGIAAAAAGNGLGIAGVGAGSPLIICRAIGADGAGASSDIAACIGWVVRKHARIISMSLGGPDSKTLSAAVGEAAAAGALIVAAAGNSGNGETEFPAGYKQVVSVAATGPKGTRAEFSNANADVEIAAPGVDILSLAPGNRYRLMSGTSMAAPHVAGAAALLWQAHPGDDAAQIRARLDHTVRDAGRRGRDSEYGFGVLDLAAATA